MWGRVGIRMATSRQVAAWPTNGPVYTTGENALNEIRRPLAGGHVALTVAAGPLRRTAALRPYSLQARLRGMQPSPAWRSEFGRAIAPKSGFIAACDRWSTDTPLRGSGGVFLASKRTRGYGYAWWSVGPAKAVSVEPDSRAASSSRPRSLRAAPATLPTVKPNFAKMTSPGAEAP